MARIRIVADPRRPDFPLTSSSRSIFNSSANSSNLPRLRTAAAARQNDTLSAELHDAGIAGCRDRAEVRCAQHRVRVAQRWCVKHIENLNAEFRPYRPSQTPLPSGSGVTGLKVSHRALVPAL